MPLLLFFEASVKITFTAFFIRDGRIVWKMTRTTTRFRDAIQNLKRHEIAFIINNVFKFSSLFTLTSFSLSIFHADEVGKRRRQQKKKGIIVHVIYFKRDAGAFFPDFAF